MLVLILLTDIDPHLLQEESKTCPRDSNVRKRPFYHYSLTRLPFRATSSRLQTIMYFSVLAKKKAKIFKKNVNKH